MVLNPWLNQESSVMQHTSKLISFAFVTLLLAGAAFAEKTPANDFDMFQKALKEAKVWSGGPDEKADEVGRNGIATLIENGLNPTDKVLDIGAGSLRLGWWILQFVDEQNFHAVEPSKNRIDTAARLMGADIHIYYNEDWQFPDEKFDFVVARSIWSHAAKWMISIMISEFAENSSPEGIFLASVRLAGEKPDYMGDEWIGRPAQTGDVRKKTKSWRMVNHSEDWLHAEAAKNGLKMEVLDTVNNQTWVALTHAK